MNRKRFVILLLSCLALVLCSFANQGFGELEKLVLNEKPDSTKAPSKDPDIQALRQDIKNLQKRVAALEERVREIAEQQDSSGDTSSSSAVPPQAGWWQLRVKMSKSEVKGLLGAPGEVVKQEWNEYWYYPDKEGGMVKFDVRGAVQGWEEP